MQAPHSQDEKPAEVTESTDFEPAINLQTARALGVKVASPLFRGGSNCLGVVLCEIRWLDAFFVITAWTAKGSPVQGREPHAC
jgi:hypothetical protein